MADNNTSKFITREDLNKVLNKLSNWMPFSKRKNSLTNEELGLETNGTDDEIALGSYNKSENDTQFSIGVGSPEERKNAIEVKDNGDVYMISGNVYVTNSDGQQITIKDIVNSTNTDEWVSIKVDEIKALTSLFDSNGNPIE
jgi:hypothetical protein